MGGEETAEGGDSEVGKSGVTIADELAAYDGRVMIGTTRRDGPHAFVAKALDGKKLGTFPDQAAATHAVRAAAWPAGWGNLA